MAMTRIRTIKPELGRHQGLFELERKHGMPFRIIWALFPAICDREGRFRWRPWDLKLDIVPYDEIDFNEVMEILLQHGFLHRYSVNGELYGTIPTFLKHQSINNRESPSVIPAPTVGIEMPSKRGRAIPKETQALIWATQEHFCRNCAATENLTIDHIVPFSKGGSHEISNLQILCRSCNSAKQDKLPHASTDKDNASSRVGTRHEGNRTEGNRTEGNRTEGKGTEPALPTCSEHIENHDSPPASNPPVSPPPPPRVLGDLWNELTPPEMPKVYKPQKLPKEWHQAARKRLEEEPEIEVWREAIMRILQSDFLTGRKPSKEYPDWKADFEFLIRESTLAKLFGGKYDNAGSKQKKQAYAPSPDYSMTPEQKASAAAARKGFLTTCIRKASSAPEAPDPNSPAVVRLAVERQFGGAPGNRDADPPKGATA